MKKNVTQILLLLLTSLAAHAQDSDTVLVAPMELGVGDIITAVDLTGDNVKMISGNRFPISAADLPFSTYVITAEEIRRNCYETLVDALKMAPGIRVSQPGSAIEGETFLMRGLLGNTYTKILIDDVPIKPSFLASMPIGAQLPIKEAERIEIIYGSGAALYGADASAGVINIVTKQSEKPVFMQADLSVGGGQYSAVNVMFGGKLGRDRNIFKYFAYASNVLLDERNIFYDRNFNYNPAHYPTLTGQDTSYVLLPNYAGSSATNPLLTNTPHLSRRFGGYVKFRRMTLSVESMYRQDHSSLGLNPVAVSYRNPLNYTGERINRVNLNFFKDKPKHNRKTDITYIGYQMDDRSSVTFVRNDLTVELENAALAAANSTDPAAADSLRRAFFYENYDRYFNGSRYRYDLSGELRLEHVQNYRLFKYVTFTLGLNGKIAGGFPFTEFLSRPPVESDDIIGTTDFDALEFDSLTFPIIPSQRALAEGNFFSQVFYNGKRFNLAGGINWAAYGTVNDVDASVNSLSKRSGRLSGLYKITENMNIRTSWGRSFRVPNEWFPANSYSVDSGQELFLSRNFLPLKPEVTTSWESGIRFKSGDNISSEFTWFSNQTSDLIGFTKLGGFNADSTLYSSFIGYRNNEGASIRYTGGQITAFFSLIEGKYDKKILEGSYSYGWTDAKLTLTETNKTIDLPQGAGRLHQLRVILRPTENTTLIFDYLKTKKLGRRAGPDAKNKYATLDITARYALSRHFECYAKAINVFNQHYSGIPASRTPNDLIYNPQTGFFIRLGMNYYLE